MPALHASQRQGPKRWYPQVLVVWCCALSTTALPIGCGRGDGPEPGPARDSAGQTDDRLEAPPGALAGWNVLLVSIDTLRADHVGCYGYPRVETPVMDGLARRGVRFTQAIAPAPLTLPSHTSMLTGLTPQHHGVRMNGLFQLDAGVPTLAEMLAAGGYRTAAFLSSVVLDRRYGLARGFSHYDDQWPGQRAGEELESLQRRAGPTTTSVLSWLDKHGRETFFVWVHYFDPHIPYDPPEPFAARYPSAPYDGEIAYADQQLGVLLQGLERNQIRSQTLVVVLSDHGEGLGDHGEAWHGSLIYDTTVHVPLIVNGPPHVPQGRLVTRQVGVIDVVPTILALVGQPIPAGLDGVSLLQPPGRDPRALYIETLGSKFSHGWAPLLGIRRSDYKFIFAPKPELYDLRRDPDELHDRYGAEPGVAGDLYELLRKRVGSDPELVTAVQANLALTPETRAQLESLGYVMHAEPSTTRPHTPAGVRFADLPNPKDLIVYSRHRIRARMLLRNGRYDKAINLLEPYVAKVPQDGKALAVLGLCYDAKKRPSDALACFERAAKLADRDASLASEIGSFYQSKGDLDKAVKYFKQALDLVPQQASSLEQLGQVYRSRGRDDEAMTLFDRLMKASRGRYAAKAHYEIGRTHLARGRLDQAEQAFKHATTIDPSYSQATAAALKAHHADQTIQRLRRAVATQPTADSLSSLGKLLRERGGPAEAIPYLQQALQAGGAKAQTHRQLGLALESTDRRAEGIRHLRLAVRLDPNSVEAHMDLGNALGRSRQWPDALKHFNRAGELDPKSPTVPYKIGLVLAEQGRWDQAATKLREALELDPGFVQARIRLGQVLENLGQRDQAVACYRQVLRAEPKHKQARTLLRQARRRASRAGARTSGSQTPAVPRH